MEYSLQFAHPDIFDRISLYLPLLSRLQLAATCRSMKSSVVFKHGRSQLENLPPSVLKKTMRCLSSHADRLRLGAASWTLRKWAIQNELLTFHCDEIIFQEDCIELYDKDCLLIGTLPLRDGDLPIRVTATQFTLYTDFSRVHIDQSIRRLSAFRPPLRPDDIHLLGSDILDGRSDDPTAVRRLVEYLGGTSRPFNELICRTRHNKTLLLESDFLHRVQAHSVHLEVGDIGPDGLDFAVEDSVQDGVQLGECHQVIIDLEKRESLTSSPQIIFNSLLRFVRAHFSPSQSVRFKYDVLFSYCGDVGSAAIRTLADECGAKLKTRRNGKVEKLWFKTTSVSTRRVVSLRWLETARHEIFVGAGEVPW